MNVISGALNSHYQQTASVYWKGVFLGDLEPQGEGSTVSVLGSHSSFQEARKKIYSNAAGEGVKRILGKGQGHSRP